MFRSVDLTPEPQTGVALERVSTFLDEEEIPEQFSALKRPAGPRPDQTLGIENGSFKWNELTEKAEEPAPKKRWRWSTSQFSTDSQATVDTVSSQSAVPFELTNISVIFPAGTMTVVTGPTACECVKDSGCSYSRLMY